jgi:5-bromo-4-chloroindolyl phosphate hydrolysis protein
MSSNQIRGAPVSTTEVLTAMKAPLAKLRARLAVAKSAALFLLPLPLLIAVVAALIADDSRRLALSAGALGCFWTAGVLTWRGLANEMRYLLGDQTELDRIPRKMLSAAVTAGGAALAALAAGHSPSGAATFAAVGAVGHLCFYGLDKRSPRVTVTPVEGVDVTSVTDQLEHAHRRLRGIEAASRGIAVPEFRSRLAQIIALGRRILDEIARDPRNATRTRRFLNLFLDSTQRITEEYARTHQGLRSRPLEENFRNLLIEMEHAFSAQHRKLLESDAVSLDVDIDVLNARLKQESAGLYVEQRND